MKKHIKFSAEAIGPDFDKIKVVILEQSHKDIKFGNDNQYFHHDGFSIGSSMYPQYASDKMIWLRGADNSKDTTALVLPVATYKKFKAAVEAYNKEFANYTKCYPYKHIKASATPVGPDFDKVEVQILECPNYSEFSVGGSVQTFNPSTSKTKLIADSAVSLALVTNVVDKYTKALCIGIARTSTTKMSVEDWKEVRKAIEEYNTVYSGKTPMPVEKPKATKAKATAKKVAKAAPKEDACVTIVG